MGLEEQLQVCTVFIGMEMRPTEEPDLMRRKSIDVLDGETEEHSGDFTVK